MRWLDYLPRAWNLGTARAFGLQIQNGLLAKKDKKLPFGGHVICMFQHIDLVQYFVIVVVVWTKEVVVGNPKS